MQKSNIIKFVIRGHDEKDIKSVLRDDLTADEQPIKVIEYAYGKEGGDSDEHHPHMHVVIRVDKALPDNPIILRTIWDIDNHPNIQDIRLGDNFTAAAKYACKDGDYCWPSQYIPPPWDDEKPEWYECQQAILDELEGQNMRQILCVVDPAGNTGKTYLMKWMALRFKAVLLPISNNYRDVMRFAYDLSEKGHVTLHTVFIDVPRSFPKNNLRALYSAIETLKDGTIWDDRWELNMRIDLAPPKICVMTNIEPDYGLLTADRWVIQTIRLDGSVVRSRAPYADYLERQSEQRELRRKRHREAQRRYMERKLGLLAYTSEKDKTDKNENG